MQAIFSCYWDHEGRMPGGKPMHSKMSRAACAGLAAARQLRSFGYNVVVLEGHARPGGRVYTKQLQVGFC